MGTQLGPGAETAMVDETPDRARIIFHTEGKETVVSPDDSRSSPRNYYCKSCYDPIPSEAEFCPVCGAPQTPEGETEPNSATGVTSWGIGFRPGKSGRNALVAVAYFLFYVVGIPLLLFAYWRRGGKYRRRTYAILGGVAVFLVAIAAFGALAGPIDDGETGAAMDSPTESAPTTDPAPEYSIRISYSGSWQGAVSVAGAGSSQTESISGSGTRTVEITGSVDIISVNAQKQDDSSARITVQILHNGEVIAESSTASPYGVAQTSTSV